jgi:hypothetical protein
MRVVLRGDKVMIWVTSRVRRASSTVSGGLSSKKGISSEGIGSGELISMRWQKRGPRGSSLVR